MSSSIEAVKERTEELIQLVDIKSAGRATILPVVKGFGVKEVEAMLELGLFEVGESYAQEVLRKSEILPSDKVIWHMIGNIQRNKVKKLSGIIELWHSVYRMEIIEEISKFKQDSKILIQVDMHKRYEQGGCSPEEVSSLVESATERGLNVQGLMTIGLNQNIEETKKTFASLSKLSESLGLKEISMGMSDDFEIAIDHGATILRLGRAIFGERSKD
ncbi:MAG: YggS family pyridoxal phosphate-dependent enzyme [Actinobacteria bacterium]|nr:YggS family pyridoxal phosphate-dependent enzyme [Actinomycetota bacterium]